MAFNRTKGHKYYQGLLIENAGRALVSAVYNYLHDAQIPEEQGYYALPEFSVNDQEKTVILDAFLLLGGNLQKDISVGIEIKDQMKDLLYGEKLDREVGHTDLFFLAVPHKLIPAALCVINDRSVWKKQHIGLCNADTGRVIAMPDPYYIPVEEKYSQAEEMQRILHKRKHRTVKVKRTPNTGGFPPHTDTYEFIDGFLANRDDLATFEKVVDTGYDFTSFVRKVGRPRYEHFRRHERYARLKHLIN